jgi:hypothetical protein
MRVALFLSGSLFHVPLKAALVEYIENEIE